MSLKSRLKPANEGAPPVEPVTPESLVIETDAAANERAAFAFAGAAPGYDGTTPTDVMVGAIRVTSR